MKWRFRKLRKWEECSKKVSTKNMITVWDFFWDRKREGGMITWREYNVPMFFFPSMMIQTVCPWTDYSMWTACRERGEFQGPGIQRCLCYHDMRTFAAFFLLFQALQLVGGIYDLHRVWLFLRLWGNRKGDLNLGWICEAPRRGGCRQFWSKALHRNIAIVLSASETHIDRS